MIDLDKFSALQKASKQSFHQQKTMIKKLILGQEVLCAKCQQVLTLNLPANKGTKTKIENKASSISCPKGCTDIELDFIP